MPGPNDEPVGRNVLQPQTVAMMYMSVLATDGNGLGYVMETLPDGTRMALHSGDILGWRGQYTALPDDGKGIVVLTNSNAGGRYVVASTTCRWIKWAAGDVPNACRIYRAVDVAILAIAGIIGFGVAVVLWRLVTQMRVNRIRLEWPPKTGQQRRDIVLALVAIAIWWAVVAPRLGILLPPVFNWISLAITLWFLVKAAKGLMTSDSAPTI
jgi:hypothetical protein